MFVFRVQISSQTKHMQKFGTIGAIGPMWPDVGLELIAFDHRKPESLLQPVG